jgi:hypothetical protein
MSLYPTHYGCAPSATPASRLADPSASLVFIELVMPLVMQVCGLQMQSNHWTMDSEYI